MKYIYVKFLYIIILYIYLITTKRKKGLLMSNTEKVRVENLFKIFGPKPKTALKLLEQGKDKDQILEETGMTVGVQNASFTVNKGEIFVVMGLSGSGKSTLVRMLNRLIEPTSGSVYIDGEDVAKMNQDELIQVRRKKMCMVFQSFALMPHMSVIDNVSFGLELSGMDKTERHDRALEALEQVGLAPYAENYPDELSGGMQQRVGLARALAVNPDVLLMDEAFSALDPLIRCEMQDELITLQENSQRTIIFISHDLDEAIKIGDRIAIMEGGRVVQVGTPEEILRNPADDYVRAFFRGVDPTNIITAGDIARNTQVQVIRHPGDGAATALQRLRNHDRDYGYVMNKNKEFIGIVTTDTLQKVIKDEKMDDDNLKAAMIEGVAAVKDTDSMQDILTDVSTKPYPIPVVNENNKYLGVISKNIFLRTLDKTEDAVNSGGN